MSFEAIVAVALAINLACVMAALLIARRSGHDPFPWVLISGVIGPFGLIALLGSGRDAAPAVVPSSENDVLIPTDGSAPSLEAVDHFIASHTGGRGVTLLAVLPVERRQAPPAELEADIESHVGAARRRLEGGRVPCQVATAFGDAATEIVRFAKEGNYKHILMGRRGRGGVAKLLLGSVSDKVLKEAPIPVTVAG